LTATIFLSFSVADKGLDGDRLRGLGHFQEGKNQLREVFSGLQQGTLTLCVMRKLRAESGETEGAEATMESAARQNTAGADASLIKS